MTDSNPIDIDSDIVDFDAKRRKDLLPKWIKVFCWIFLIMGIMGMIAPVVGLLGFSFELSLYGLETNRPLSITGLSISFLFSIKAVTALSLIKEQEHAVFLAIMDATIGIMICSYLSFIYPLVNENMAFNFRAELILLIPYFIKMWRIKDEWKMSG